MGVSAQIDKTLVKAPSGFTLVEEYTNTLVYKQNNESNYVQVIDLRGGAKFDISAPFYKSTVAGEPRYNRADLNKHWLYVPKENNKNLKSEKQIYEQSQK